MSILFCKKVKCAKLIFSEFFVGIGMDSSITPLRHGGLSLVQTTDFFYPLVEDPYMQGECEILSSYLITLELFSIYIHNKFTTILYLT